MELFLCRFLRVSLDTLELLLAFDAFFALKWLEGKLLEAGGG